jgi:hypothetical protein
MEIAYRMYEKMTPQQGHMDRIISQKFPMVVT